MKYGSERERVRKKRKRKERKKENNIIKLTVVLSFTDRSGVIISLNGQPPPASSEINSHFTTVLTIACSF